jgi:transmembrane sensor
MVDDGEAFFTVAKDPRRPFVVRAGGLQVIAVGTAFNVRKAGDRIVVTVTEGAVRVAPNEGSSSGAVLAAESSDGQVRAGAGHQVTWSARQHALAMTTAESALAKRPAWLDGRLEFVNEPLGSVITDINRYSSRPVVLADEQLRDLVFTGTLRSDAIEDWLQGLEDVFPVVLTRQGGQDVLSAGQRR